MRIENAKDHIGGIVHVDKAHMCDDDVVAACREALEDRAVLVFPQINLTDAEQLAFTDKFGERVKFTGTVPGGEDREDDQLYKITLDRKFNKEPDYVLGTFFWHIDGVTIDQPLPKATFLSARILSPTGGQTEFTNTMAAYAALPEETKQRIADLKVIHRMEASMRPLYHTEMPAERLERYRSMASWMVHPLVWTQKSGKKSLVLGTHADEIVGMSIPEGRALLTELTEWCAQKQFTYRHEWQVGDFVVWNNCGAMHRVIPYPDDCPRMMHRTTIMGTERLGVPWVAAQAA